MVSERIIIFIEKKNMREVPAATTRFLLFYNYMAHHLHRVRDRKKHNTKQNYILKCTNKKMCVPFCIVLAWFVRNTTSTNANTHNFNNAKKEFVPLSFLSSSRQQILCLRFARNLICVVKLVI